MTDETGLPDWLTAMLVCPVTRTPLVWRPEDKLLVSKAAGLSYPVIDGIPHLLPECAKPWPPADGRD